VTIRIIGNKSRRIETIRFLRRYICTFDDILYDSCCYCCSFFLLGNFSPKILPTICVFSAETFEEKKYTILAFHSFPFFFLFFFFLHTLSWIFLFIPIDRYRGIRVFTCIFQRVPMLLVISFVTGTCSVVHGSTSMNRCQGREKERERNREKERDSVDEPLTLYTLIIWRGK